MTKIRSLGTTDKIWPVDSRKSVAIPFEDLIVGGKLEIYPEVEGKGYFTVRYSGRNLVLSAGRYIGLIPINSRVTVQVNPKLPVDNLARIIEISQRPIGVLALTQRPYLTEPASFISVIEFLTRNLLYALRDVELHGLHKTYTSRTSNSSSPRGRLDIRRTGLLNFSRGIRHKVYSKYYEQTIDNSYNQLLKYALWFVAQRLSRVPNRNRQLMRDLNAALGWFDGVALRSSAYLIEQIDHDLRRERIPPHRQYYAKPLRLALTILSNKVVSLIGHGREVELSSYIIDFEKLFEDYLRQVLRTRIPNMQPGANVRSGGDEPKKLLFDDAEEHTADPDIIIDIPPDKRVVAEVKYRDKIDRSDINQAITYGCSFRVENMVLVFQSPIGESSDLKRLGCTNGINLYAYKFDLTNTNLEAEERAFTTVMLGLARPCRS